MIHTTVAQYYDSNTTRFLRLGGSGELAAIHRAVWAPGVRSRTEAFGYINHRVAETFGYHAGPLLDVGCGVGGTATWLALAQGIHVTGITLSPVQARLAEGRAARLGADCTFQVADFHDLPAALGVFGCAYAIEAFAHAEDPGRFFVQLAAHLAPGARLFIADDFLAPRASQIAAASPWLRRVRRDWHLTTLLPVARVVRLGGQAGFHLAADLDFSPYLRTWSPPWLGLVAALTRLPIRTPYWQNLSGGAALQYCYRRGWAEYHALRFDFQAVDP